MQKGKLTTWKDDRGFGFIKPEDSGKEIFLYISAVKGASRRPKVGDVILYQKIRGSDGRVRAANASIQGVFSQHRTASRTAHQTPKKSNGVSVKTVAAIVALSATVISATQSSPSLSPSPIQSITQPECVIKGNISINSGKKWYHLPDMEDYDSTVIDLSKGEKWFCSESEAVSQGWRKAPN